MKKRLFTLLALAIIFVLPGHAVLKESNLDTTLVMLRSELTHSHVQLEQQAKIMKNQNKALITDLFSILNQANQNSIMLYSQRDGYIFDMAYACHEATEQFHNFKNKSKPFRKSIDDYDTKIARYDSLIQSLSSMPTIYISDDAKINRNVCLTLAVNIRRQLVESRTQLNTYLRFYNFTEQRLKTLNDYANKRYDYIQNSIFNNGSDNFFTVLKHLGSYFNETSKSVSDKYRPSKHFMSQWDARYIIFLFGIIVFYGFISIFINVIIIRFILTYLMKKGWFANIKDQFMDKRPCIMMAMMAVTFAIILGVIRATVQQNFLIMASGLLVEYAWLLGVILISLILRVDGTQIKSAFRIYTPMIVMGFIVIAFRIILIPNDMVNLIFPPILLICALWQWNVITRHRSNVPKSDMIYTSITLLVFIASVISSWSGYTLLSVQLLIWWIMQLTCILTITCVREWLRDYAKIHEYEKKTIFQTWFYRLVYYLIIPIAGVASLIISIYWATDVFNLSDTSWEIFTKNYVDFPQISFSLFNICQVIVLYFIFSYLNNTVKDILKIHFEKSDPTTADSRYMMTKNVMQILVWGIWLLISISICHISYTWFVVVSGGLSTGIGFAMKDILENIYYGVSLMAGRIKIGDYIVCDGVRGRVSSISYTSTQLEAIDGSVIAFQNSQLFTKNYKNMTKNHGYELDILEVGVAYGSDIENTKKLLVDNLMRLDCIFKEKGVRVILKSFDDSCITLRILVWVNVLTQSIDDGRIMEAIYKTFSDNNIEIPFPQREITIKHEGAKPVSHVETPVLSVPDDDDSDDNDDTCHSKRADE